MDHSPAPPGPDTAGSSRSHPPALVLGARTAVLVSADGEIETLDPAEGAVRIKGMAPLVCHWRAIRRRLKLDPEPAHDVLELFAFARPGHVALPTPRGLAMALGLPVPETLEDEALSLQSIARHLLDDIAERRFEPEGTDAPAMADVLQRAGWPWGVSVLAALDTPHGISDARRRKAFDVWNALPAWTDSPPEPPPRHDGVPPSRARERLAEMLAGRADGTAAEPRPQQADYASAVTPAFDPRPDPDSPNIVLAEAGTGVGKTLGYLAPATVWAEQNQGTVWISTYTRNLQHQIDQELDALYPASERENGAGARHDEVVIRKGRENYLCLLNLEETARNLPMNPGSVVPVALIARWAAASRNGDMTGGDYPGWLTDLVGRGHTIGLADRRGECVYSACPHYNRCYIERSVRQARKARIVIANHALVLVQSALGGVDDTSLPTRYVFDEGHHLFDAADSAFGAHLSGTETFELRRWLAGAGTGGRSRARGLRRRVEDLIESHGEGRDALAEALDAVEVAAQSLAGDGWLSRIADGQPRGPAETFLAAVRRQVYARDNGRDGPYGLETDVHPLDDGLLEDAGRLAEALKRLQTPMETLASGLGKRLDADAETLDSDTRRRLEAAQRGIRRRAQHMVAGWRAMLTELHERTPETFVDWFAIERMSGRDVDVGMHRRWVDPTVPLAGTLGPQAHGIVVTSATLTDGTGDVEADWHAAEQRSGSIHLPRPAIRASVLSPFDYPNQARVFIVTDVRKDDFDQVAAAYRSLFLASGGGGLGLFTAIARLAQIHRRISGPLDEAGLPLLAQHLDGLDVSTLMTLFRAEENACLLGTDAVRDGIDVPGRSLRLLVFDRVPWPRPDILHRARREAFGRKAYDDMITRLRLKQAFGRLIRRASDSGVFVLLDPMMPSRLLGAFPDRVAVKRTGLAEAVAETRAFLNPERDVTPDR